MRFFLWFLIDFSFSTLHNSWYRRAFASSIYIYIYIYIWNIDLCFAYNFNFPRHPQERIFRFQSVFSIFPTPRSSFVLPEFFSIIWADRILGILLFEKTSSKSKPFVSLKLFDLCNSWILPVFMEFFQFFSLVVLKRVICTHLKPHTGFIIAFRAIFWFFEIFPDILGNSFFYQKQVFGYVFLLPFSLPNRPQLDGGAISWAFFQWCDSFLGEFFWFSIW